MKLQSMFPGATAKAGGILVADLFVAEEADDSFGVAGVNGEQHGGLL